MTTPMREAINRLPAYSMGVQDVNSVERVIQLGQNELGVPASPAAIAAIQKCSHQLPRYSDMDHVLLRKAIADVQGLDASRIACGSGSMELMNLLATIYCEPGVEVILSQYGYMFFQVLCSVAGANLVIIQEPEMIADLDAIAAAVTEHTRLVFVVNPNNPTGATLETGSLRRLRDSIPDEVLIIVDCAYADFADADNYENGFDLVDEGNNMVILRTLSKAYGLAGSRVGWIYAPDEVIQAIAKVRTPNSITTQALAAAEAAIRDQTHLQRVVAEVIELREDLRAKILELGLEVYPSGGNFLLVRFHNAEQADDVYQGLLRSGIIVRPMGSYQLHDCLRVTIGSSEEMEIFWQRFVDLINGVVS